MQGSEGPTSGIGAVQVRLHLAPGSETGDNSGAAGGDCAAGVAQPRQEVVVHMVREVSGTSWPTLTCTNYGEWAVTMKVKLRARQV